MEAISTTLTPVTTREVKTITTAGISICSTTVEQKLHLTDSIPTVYHSIETPFCYTNTTLTWSVRDIPLSSIYQNQDIPYLRSMPSSTQNPIISSIDQNYRIPNPLVNNNYELPRQLVTNQNAFDGNHGSSHSKYVERDNVRPLHPKWKLLFDGDPKILDVHDFIFRLETFARRDGYSTHRLPSLIHNFVSGTAEKWLWTFLRDHTNDSWEELRNGLLSRFSSHESERETRRFIERRVQKHKESFNEFSLEIQSLNGRLTNRFSEIELIEILRENMHSQLQTMTLQTNFSSVEQLRMVCQKYEQLWIRSHFDVRGSYDMSGSRRSYAVNELDAAPEKIAVKNLDIIGRQSTEISAVQSNLNIPHRTISNNREDNKNIQHFVCYKCHLPGFTVRTCPNCNPQSENSTPNATRPGELRSDVMPQPPSRT